MNLQDVKKRKKKEKEKRKIKLASKNVTEKIKQSVFERQKLRDTSCESNINITVGDYALWKNIHFNWSAINLFSNSSYSRSSSIKSI